MGVHFPEKIYRCVIAENLVPANGALARRLSGAVALYGGDLLVCHRDAERDPHSARLSEVQQAAVGLNVCVVPVVPVRMTEAWFLFDQAAIRCAANNSAGRMDLFLPRRRDLESLPNPKDLLHAVLCNASGLTGQRLKKFNPHVAKHRVANFISDFSPLRSLNSFVDFERSFCSAIMLL